jgi:hypothetical protein
MPARGRTCRGSIGAGGFSAGTGCAAHGIVSATAAPGEVTAIARAARADAAARAAARRQTTLFGLLMIRYILSRSWSQYFLAA